MLLAGQAGKPVTFEVTCNVVKKKVTPEVTDEWAKEKMGFESVEDMRERIKESLNAQKGSLMPRIKENNIMVELRDRVEGDVPSRSSSRPRHRCSRTSSASCSRPA